MSCENQTPIDPNELVNLFKSQQKYLNFFFQNLDPCQTLTFTQTLLNAKGTLFFTGVGKSGFVAQKISQTLTSFGIPSAFLSPPAVVGGGDTTTTALSKSDILVIFCKSGNSGEILELVPCIKAKGVYLVSVTSIKGNVLEGVSDLNVHLPLDRELCPYNLTPVTSSAIQLIFGDTVAIALLGARNLKKVDYNHPTDRIVNNITSKMDDEIGLSLVPAPKQKDAVTEEHSDTSQSKTTAGFDRGTPSRSKSINDKRKSGTDDVKVSDGTPPAKKAKTKDGSKSFAKDRSATASKGGSVPKEVQPSAGSVMEDEIRAVLMQKSPVAIQDFVAKFKARIKSPKGQGGFCRSFEENHKDREDERI